MPSPEPPIPSPDLTGGRGRWRELADALAVTAASGSVGHRGLVPIGIKLSRRGLRLAGRDESFQLSQCAGRLAAFGLASEALQALAQLP